MGVPAFYRWLSEKYPKIVQDILEERVHLAPNSGSVRLPFDATAPNPSGLECDNLYIDMNGIIHPCSHPEVGPQPSTEEEMYENVCRYVDRLFRIMRPRKLLYLAIDGVAPRAKMNQQRARRFRSAQEARELVELEAHVRNELIESGQAVPPTKSSAWDSNVITPGTTFMLNLATYVRWYVRWRISTDPAWRTLKVIFSDASIPGEGEHKIMSHIRLQRAQPGYDPNLVHVLHGLDADLIMLALATHEAHFYISREEVMFGRKSQEEQEQRQLESGFKDAQRSMDEAAGAEAMQLTENLQKPLQRISIPILREYLAAEFAMCVTPGRLPFEASLERLLDDIVFLCFFVGNDFLPHLPSLDIRDGALDYLFNVYKRLLPGLGDYITKSGGNVNLSHVDVLLAEVGAIEDHVFGMKHENEMREQKRRADMNARRQRGNNPPPSAPPAVPPARQGRAAKILAKQEAEARALSQSKGGANKTIVVSHQSKNDNTAAAQALKESLLGTKRSREATEAEDTTVVVVQESEKAKEKSESASDTPQDKRKIQKDSSVVGDAEDEFDMDDDDDDVPANKTADVTDDPEAAKRLKERVKSAVQKKLDNHSKGVEDKVRLHEAGWKDRYYTDKCKADDIQGNGGREHLFLSYVKGLCWVMKYYYDGCPSWKWYYPFHYAPFASDLKNIDRFEKKCKSFELAKPFNPVEQLMAVLPSDSAHAIPVSARWLMKDPESPILDFYPMDVPVDPNGKAMPWLWVVLLAFVDEERLLAAMGPNMAEWTKDELLCNAKGLDDGYLYVHRDFPLAKKFAAVLQKGKTANDPKTRLTDAAVYGCAGFSGSVRPPLSNELYPIDEPSVVPLPPSASKITSSDCESIFTEPIDPNDAVCVAFTEPPKLSHKSILLPGVKVAAPVLTADDKRIRRPRLNRGGGSIANMGVSNGQSYKSGYGSMNVSSYERNLAHQNGRGNEMYQTGNRAWGAMEPAPKRRNMPQQIPNQFGNHQQRPGGRGPGGYDQNHNRHPPPSRGQQQQQQYGYQNNQYQAHPPGPPQQRGPPHQIQHYQGNGQQHGGGFRQHQGYQNVNGYGQTRGQNPNQMHQNRGPPQQRQQGFNFRSFNQGPPSNQYQRGGQAPPPPPNNGDRRSRASADVMNNLRAQLSSTLNNQNRNGTGNRR